MSAHNNNNGTNDKEQKESEVEAAVGRAYVRGGDSLRERRLPATVTRDLDVLSTQLDVLAREQEESKGSSSEKSGPSSEGSGSLPGMQGGVTQEHKTSWTITGRLSAPFGNKRGLSDPTTGGDKSPEVALMCGCHIKVTPWIAGVREARETLGLTKEDDEKVLVLRDCILRHCFRELDTMDEHEWQNQMSCARKWQR
jgi:hypothetical protein